MKDVVLILLVALIATWVAVPRGAPAVLGAGGTPLPDIDQVGIQPSSIGNPLTSWLVGQLWKAVYALEGIQ